MNFHLFPASGYEDRPVQEIKIIAAIVYIDPFLQIEKLKLKEAEEEKNKEEEIKRQMDRGKWFSQPSLAPKSSSNSVGKYLTSSSSSSSSSSSIGGSEGGLKRKLELQEGAEHRPKKKITSDISKSIEKW
jgi:hypothetical protein